MRMMLRLVATGLTVIGPAWAQDQPGREPPGGGPWNNDVLVYRVSPNGEVIQIATFERAGVPTIARMKDGRLVAAHQHFPDNNDADFDKVAVRFSPDDGRNWTAPQVIRLDGLPEGMRFPFDPTLVPLPDGRVRLYFTGNTGGTLQRSTPAIHSAVSTDGVNYTYEPGVRFAVAGRTVIDCAVVLHNGVFHLYAPDNGAQMQPGRPPRNQAAIDRPREGVGYHATSKDGLNFTRVEDVYIEGRRWLGNALSNGKSITFFGTGPGGVWMGVSNDGREFRLVQKPPIPVADPGAVALREGGWIVVGTGPPVRGRPGAMGRPAFGEPPPGPPGQPRGGRPFAGSFPPGRPLGPGGDGPWNHRVLLATSKDGLSWSVSEQVLAERASVPELFAGPDGSPVVLFVDVSGESHPGALGAMVQDATGSWVTRRTNLRGADPNVVRLRENTYRAYTKERDGSIQVYSSANGLDWEWVGEAFRDERYRHATDSDVFETPDGWVMLISLGPTLLRCTSRDGLKFTTDGTILELGGSVSDTVPVPGGWRTFFHVNADPRTGGKMVIRSAFTADGRSWRVEEGDRLRAPDDGPARLGVADPSPLQLPDGTWLMAVKSFIEPSRPGTASALQPRARPDGPPDNRLVRGGAPRFPNNEPERRERTDIRSPEGGAPGFRDAGTAARDSQRGEPLRARGQIRVEKIDSKYKVASGAKPGVFATGQDADLMLGGFGFNNTGGALRFNHPTGLASDGKMLLMTDRWNNRVLVWKSAPAKNTPPDLVLGQPDFTQNNPGKGKHQMNWPGNVAITPDGQKIAVTDTDNDRILIWNSFPTTSGAPADLVLDLAALSGGVPAPGVARPPNDGERRSSPRREPGGFPRPELESAAPPGRRAGPEAGEPNATPRPRFGGGMRFGWPWGVWTDGKKLAVVATHGSAVLTWNAFPARDNQPPDLVLRPTDAGTPRNVTSDGNWFAVSDHNNRPANRPATMVWRTFPTSSTQEPDFKWGEWMKGSFTPDRQLVLAGMAAVWIWNQTPSSDSARPDVELRPAGYRNGDGPDAVVANGRFYVCNYNGNNLLVWNALPTRDNQPPDFSLGSDTPEQDVWAENFFIQNPVVATDGQSLFISSDFDRKLFVWRQLPDESGARPDLVFHLPEAPWDNALHGQTLALAGKSTVVIWRKLPLSGEQPDLVLSGSIGSIRLGELTGVALDDRYFYLSDRQSDSIYVWEGIPAHDQEPKCTLPMRSPGHLNSDGTYLAAAPFEGQAILLWRVNELGSGAQATSVGGLGRFNLPGQALVAKGHLFVADRGFNRVHVWHRLEDALAGKAADALLGAENDQDRDPEIGRSKLFSPGSLAFGRGYLWVGEFKFSTRILRFSPEP